MTEIITQNKPTERDLQLENTIKYGRALYSEWLFLARTLCFHWDMLIREGEWKKLFDEGPLTEQRFRKEKLNADEEVWKALMDLRKLIGELDEEEHERQEELRKRAEKSAGYQFDINRDLTTIIKCIKEHIREELPGVKVSVIKGGSDRGCIGSLTVAVKEMGSYEEEELWWEIHEIIGRYNRMESCDQLRFESIIVHDIAHARRRAVEEWERTGEPVPGGLQLAKYRKDKLDRERAEKRKLRELKKAAADIPTTSNL